MNKLLRIFVRRVTTNCMYYTLILIRFTKLTPTYNNICIQSVILFFPSETYVGSNNMMNLYWNNCNGYPNKKKKNIILLSIRASIILLNVIKENHNTS